MPWHTQFLNLNDPQSFTRFGNLSRMTTGRPSWVIKGTAAVAMIVFAIPLILLAFLLGAAAGLTFVTWTILSGISKLIDAVSGSTSRDVERPTQPVDDGRENVWVKER